MIGNLTIDKASMNISYFLNTIRIISLNGGRISRRDFVNQMAEFIGVSAQKMERKTELHIIKVSSQGILDLLILILIMTALTI